MFWVIWLAYMWLVWCKGLFLIISPFFLAFCLHLDNYLPTYLPTYLGRFSCIHAQSGFAILSALSPDCSFLPSIFDCLCV